MSLRRASAYIDGFNLFHGLQARKWKQYYWLDPCELIRNLIPAKENLTLAHVHFFTAPVRQGRDEAGARRQQVYLDVLETLPQLTIHYGQWFNRDMWCRKCGATWRKPEEKMSDVNLAVQLVQDAYENRFDVAYLVSGDSDLTTPVQTVRDRFPDKQVRVAFPPKRRSWHLATTANVDFSIGRTKFRDSQLPEQVTRTDGYVLKRPGTWS